MPSQSKEFDRLIKLLEGADVHQKAQYLRELINLISTNHQFSSFAKRIVLAIKDLLQEPKNNINLLASTLALQVINFCPIEAEYYIRNKLIGKLVKNLGNEKQLVRKQAHFCLLAYVRTFKKLQELLKIYIRVGLHDPDQHLRQKCINSCQSILILKLQPIDWCSPQCKSIFQTLIERLADQSLEVQSAAAQCLLSISKIKQANMLLLQLSDPYLKSYQQLCSQTKGQTLIYSPKQYSQFAPKIKNCQGAKTPSSLPNFNKFNSRANRDGQGTFKIHQAKVKENLLLKEQSLQRQNMETPTQRKLRGISSLNRRQYTGNKKSTSRMSQENAFGKNHTTVLKMQERKINDIKKMPSAIRQERNSKNGTIGEKQFFKKVEKSGKFDQHQLTQLTKLLENQNQQVAQRAFQIVKKVLDTPSAQHNIIIQHLTNSIVYCKTPLRQAIFRLLLSQQQIMNQSAWLKGILYSLKIGSLVVKQEVLSVLCKLYKRNRLLSQYEKVLEAAIPLLQQANILLKMKVLDLLALMISKTQKGQQIQHQLARSISEENYQLVLDRLFEAQKTQKLQSQRYKQIIFSPKPNKKIFWASSLTERHSQTKQLSFRTPNVADNAIKAQNPSKALALCKQNSNLSPKFIEPLNKQALQLSAPYSQAEKELNIATEQLKVGDWEICIEGLNKLKRISQHHSQLLTKPIISAVVPEIMKLVQSLRSSVSKNAVITLNHLSEKVGKSLDPQIDIILQKLIKKTMDSNSFMFDEVRKTLIAVCAHGNPSKVLNILQAQHNTKAIPMKSVIADILQSITFLSKYSEEIDKIVHILCDFMGEGAIEIRTKAKSLLSSILNSQNWPSVSRTIPSQYLQKLHCSKSRKRTDKSSPGEETFQKSRHSRIEFSSARKKISPQAQYEMSNLQSMLEKCKDADWSVRLEGMKKIKEIVRMYPQEVSYHQQTQKIVDGICKQIEDCNLKVAFNAISFLKELPTLIPKVVKRSFGIILAEIFSCFGSHKAEIRQLADEVFDQMESCFKSWMFLEQMCNGAIYGTVKSKVKIINKLSLMIGTIKEQKPSILAKYLYPMLNKVAELKNVQIENALKELLFICKEEIGEQIVSKLNGKAMQLLIE